MYQIIPLENKHEWDSIIDNLESKDIYFYQAYSSLYSKLESGQPFLFVFHNKSGNTICYPFIKRSLNTLDFLKADSSFEQVYDITTPYGYGGPLYDVMDEESINKFRGEFQEYCREENIVSEFIRFHPMLKNHEHLSNSLEVLAVNQTIFIDLTQNEEDIFNHYHKNHQRNIRKAFGNKLEFKIFKNNAIDYLEDFYQLYIKTMDKVNARSYYYFSRDYVRQLITGLKNNVIIAAVFFEGKMIAAALCMFNDNYLHYHLGCSKQETLRLGTNPFLFHHIAMWGKKNGFQRFHLGGGHSGKDTLYTFKNRFNPKGVLDFYIGKKVHNEDLYNELVRKWGNYYEQHADHSYFPAYRYPML
ncbi:GNAT family N-acetyltransferase [Bacillus sp. 31A1R]|uniref:GNAT family N-acetyltransferase n=1 Tax=Robertmurraya mangrovi TaxID=3098077 RepID=A0ABU5ITI2_9BACI|nr:GNAT family N-acetyltransferase [Bacillus sp. 31A1R]MDZ5470445.1 GNAT family N-acetyltransferase [Bacillus sp. 31A1R]